MAHGCGVHGRSWGAFCGGVEADARVLVCRESKIQVHIWSFIFYNNVNTKDKGEKIAWQWQYSRGVLHHPAPLDLHPLQHLVLMEPLHRGPECRYMVWQGLVICGQVLRQRGT